MKRSIALLASVVVLWIGAARPAAASPGAPAQPARTTAVGATGRSAVVPGDAVGLSLAQVAGSGLAVSLDPGGSEEHDVVVANHTADLRLTVRIEATDATGNVAGPAASWLAFGDDAVELDPHVAATVPLTVAVPHDTQPGSVLTHVRVTVERAVAAADGSPVTGTATATLPVSIQVRGTPTAQIAIADVHRVDDGNRHVLAVVLRNFGNEGAQVTGHVVVAGDQPQTLPFHAQLAASRDTTVDVPWRAPAPNVPSDVAVDLEYNGGNVASWSSRLGAPPTNLTTPASDTASSATTVASDSATPSTVDASSVAKAKPWWRQPWVEALAAVALAAAACWFVFEMRASRRRRDWMSRPGARVAYGPLPGSVLVAGDATTEIMNQLVRVEVVVKVVDGNGERLAAEVERARAPDPGGESVPARAEVTIRAEPRAPDAAPNDTPDDTPDETRAARAGPAPPDRGPPPEWAEGPSRPLFAQRVEFVRSAPPAAGDVARPDPAGPNAAGPDADGVVPEDAATDSTAAIMARLVELDRERRRLRTRWLEAEQPSAD